MKRLITCLLITVLTACTTPQTVLKNKETGQVARCGGNVAYAGILYPFMRAADSDCVKDYQTQGFQSIKTND